MSQLCIQVMGQGMGIWIQPEPSEEMVWSFYHRKHRSFFWEYFEEYIGLADPGQYFQLHPLQFRLLFPWPRPSQGPPSPQLRWAFVALKGTPSLPSVCSRVPIYRVFSCPLLICNSWRKVRGKHFTSEKNGGSEREFIELPICYRRAK